MSKENITRMSLAEANLHKGETDWECLEKQDAAGVEPEEGEVDWESSDRKSFAYARSPAIPAPHDPAAAVLLQPVDGIRASP